MKLNLHRYAIKIQVSKESLNDPAWQRAMKIGKARARARRRKMDKLIAQAFA